MLVRLLVLGLTVAIVLVPPRDALADAAAEAEDEDEDESEAEAADEEADEQPPVTAGGLFTRQTYPVAENQRPLILIEGMFELQLGASIDLSDREAFETWFGVAKGRYGLRDHIELQLGTTFLLAGRAGGAGGPSNGRLDVGIEPAIVHDLVDFRFTLEMPIQQGGDPFLVDVALGCPLRYRPTERIAIIALDRLMTIHTSGGKKPDLTAGLGVVLQPIDIVALLARAELTIPDFDTSVVRLPATAAVQLSPDNRFDLGLELTFANVKPPAASALGALDQRFLLLYATARL
jgi:hypothetical protein